MTENVFKENSYKYVDLPIIPLYPKQKRPMINNWSKFCHELPDEELIEHWRVFYPDANIGLCLGSASKMIAIDIDKEESLSLVPPSPIVKKGAKGETRFFKYNGEIPFKRHDVGIELLSTGNQTVMPPSIHPQTNKPYTWVQFFCDWDELPTLDPKFIETYSGNKSPSNIAVSDGTRCNHGSHTKLSEMLIAGLHSGDSPDVIVNSLLSYDEKINDLVSYFLCPTRKEWKTDNKIVNAYTFVLDAMKRHSGLVKPQLLNTESISSSSLPQINEPILNEQALYGVSGELVRLYEPHTESSSAALLLQFLISIGNIVGRSVALEIGFTKHFPNEFSLIVGASSKARKGTSWGVIERILEYVASSWFKDCQKGGLSSGEGLIFNIRDTRTITRIKKVKGVSETFEDIDPGVIDKRLLIVESEFSSVLQVLKRDGNTLSAVIRDCWDSKNLKILTKNNPVQASNPHVSIIGHITIQEFRKLVSDVDILNGFSNRFLFCYAKRSKLKPFGSEVKINDGLVLQKIFKVITEFAYDPSSSYPEIITMDNDAKELWKVTYSSLSVEHSDERLSSVVARSEAHILRLALIYCILDNQNCITVAHLNAAISLWQYCQDSAWYILNTVSKPSNENEFKIIDYLSKKKSGALRSEIGREVFNGNFSKQKIDQLKSSLVQKKLINVQYEGNREIWVKNLNDDDDIKSEEFSLRVDNSPSDLRSESKLQ